MSENSKIEWTDHTFNPWWGCARVSPGCAECYAELWAKRFGFDIWHKDGTRRFFGEKYWREPLKWDAAAQAGTRPRVFVASMADVFEEHPALPPWRERLWRLVLDTPHLDWLPLTKRPQNVARMVPPAWLDPGGWPRNLWLGTSAEDQQRADERLPELVRIPAPVLFVSAEPLLGPLDLTPWLPVADCAGGHLFEHSDVGCVRCGALRDPDGTARADGTVDWVIVGGESGAKARPMHPGWARDLRDQVTASGAAFFFKQHGEYRAHLSVGEPGWDREPTVYVCRETGRVGDEATALADGGSWAGVYRMGKTRAGRKLDGRTWDEVPCPAV